MSVLEQLLVVQEHDTLISQLEHRQAHLAERVRLQDLEREAGGLAERRADVRERRDELGRTQKRLEDEIAGLEAKRADTDARLYGGRVSAPRELQALQDELAGLARRQDQLETDLLETLTAIEPVDGELAEIDGRATDLDATIEAARAALADAEAAVAEELATAGAERDAAAAALPADRLADYERRRGPRHNVVVARLVGTSCGGCHLTLSAVQVDRIRKLPPDEPGVCEECGRLLVH